MHLYPAMGLTRQHEDQQMWLGRMTDFGLTAVLATAACSGFERSVYQRKSVASDDQVVVVSMGWRTACDHVGLQSPAKYQPLNAQVEPKRVAQAIQASDWRGCMPFVQSLTGDQDCSAFIQSLPGDQDSEAQQAMRRLLQIPSSIFS